MRQTLPSQLFNQWIIVAEYRLGNGHWYTYSSLSTSRFSLWSPSSAHWLFAIHFRSSIATPSFPFSTCPVPGNFPHFSEICSSYRQIFSCSYVCTATVGKSPALVFPLCRPKTTLRFLFLPTIFPTLSSWYFCRRTRSRPYYLYDVVRDLLWWIMAVRIFQKPVGLWSEFLECVIVPRHILGPTDDPSLATRWEQHGCKICWQLHDSTASTIMDQ